MIEKNGGYLKDKYKNLLEKDWYVNKAIIENIIKNTNQHNEIKLV